MRDWMNTRPEEHPLPASVEKDFEASLTHQSHSQTCSERWARENQKRQEWISVGAYFKAEKRGFIPGRELDDWLEAEIEHAKVQVEDFLHIMKEDGVPTILGLQTLAKSIGIAHPENIHTKTDLIQAIQCACQLRPCFRTGSEDQCNKFPDCQWRSECKKLIAEWKQHEKHL
jgi:hypothetical protein